VGALSALGVGRQEHEIYYVFPLFPRKNKHKSSWYGAEGNIGAIFYMRSSLFYLKFKISPGFLNM